MTKKKGFILEKIADMDNLRCADKETRLAGKGGRKIFPVDNVVIRRRSFDDGKSTYYFDENN